MTFASVYPYYVAMHTVPHTTAVVIRQKVPEQS
jgi:hypothetical protein